MLVIFRGLPGTGKTFLAKKLMERCPELCVLSRDALRASIIPHPIFDESEKALIDDLIVQAAAFLLGAQRSVVIDGMALSSAARVGQFVEAAQSAGVPWRIIECTCEERTALERIAADGTARTAGDRGAKLYFEVKKRFETLPWPYLIVDGGQDASSNLDAIATFIMDKSADAELPRGSGQGIVNPIRAADGSTEIAGRTESSSFRMPTTPTDPI
jgi:predicted kinase